MPAFSFRTILEVGQRKKLFLELKVGVLRGEVSDLDQRISHQSKRIARQSRRLAAQSQQLEACQQQFERLTQLVPEKDLKRALWESGKADEAQWWRHWLKKRRSRGITEDRKPRFRQLNPEVPLQEHIVEHLDASQGGVVSILDVGAGPMTQLGKIWEGRTVDITAIDPLADEYNRQLDEFDVTPLVRTQPGEVERLTDLFPTNHFDLVYMHNALDHSYDPLTGIRQMLEVVKPGGCVLLEHYVNEAEYNGYHGLHLWNFCADGDHFVIWDRQTRFSVNNILGDKAQIMVKQIPAGNSDWLKNRDWLIASLKKR